MRSCFVLALALVGCASGIGGTTLDADPSTQPDSASGPDSSPPIDASQLPDSATTPDSSLPMPDAASAIDAPPPDSPVATAAFRLNEVNPNITGSADLIELVATQGGTASGIKVQEGIASPTVLVTLPALTVAAGDLVVVHLNPPAGVTGEIGNKTDCGNAACYSGAWDVLGGTTGLTFSSRVLLVKAADGSIQDAVAFTKPSVSPQPSAFPGDLQTIQNMGLWLPANCGGSPCSYTTTPTAQAVSADWTNVGNTATGNSIHRTAATKMASDWVVGAQTFGAPN